MPIYTILTGEKFQVVAETPEEAKDLLDSFLKGSDTELVEALEIDTWTMEHTECPKHEGNFDCTPFCRTCEGEQETTKLV